MYSQHVEGRLSYSCRTYPKCKYIIKVHGLGSNNQPLSKSPWHHIPHHIEFQKPFQSSKSGFTVITFKATIPKKILVFRGAPGRVDIYQAVNELLCYGGLYKHTVYCM